MKVHGKYAKQQDEMMRDFGYELTWKKGSRGGHPVYIQAGYEPLELSTTPRDQKAARARVLHELRRRHPEHPMWRSMNKTRKRRRGTKLLTPSSPRALKLAPAPDPKGPEPDREASEESPDDFATRRAACLRTGAFLRRELDGLRHQDGDAA